MLEMQTSEEEKVEEDNDGYDDVNYVSDESVEMAGLESEEEDIADYGEDPDNCL